MSWKSVCLIVLSWMTGFTIGAYAKSIYESTSFQPYSWQKNSLPIVANCYGKDFSKTQIMRAIDYWVIRGENIELYLHNPPDEICKNEWLEGFILLKKLKNSKYHQSVLANTRRFTSITTMKGAVIYYRSGSQNLYLINEHELGHAFGYTHVDIKGHIMHPSFQHMGNDFWSP